MVVAASCDPERSIAIPVKTRRNTRRLRPLGGEPAAHMEFITQKDTRADPPHSACGPYLVGVAVDLHDPYACIQPVTGGPQLTVQSECRHRLPAPRALRSTRKLCALAACSKTALGTAGSHRKSAFTHPKLFLLEASRGCGRGPTCLQFATKRDASLLTGPRSPLTSAESILY